MNIAFPAVFIIILVLPGIICRYWYRKGKWKHPLNVEPIAEETAKSIFLAAVLHAFWVSFVQFGNYKVDLEAVLSLLVGYQNQVFEQAIQSALSDPGAVLIYFASLYVASALLGYAAHCLVRNLKLDHKHRFLRFDNPWYYLFSGEMGDFPENSDEDSAHKYNSGLVHVSAVMQQGDNAYLYFGQIETFEFDRQGNLDRLMLKYAVRRRLDNDRSADVQHQSPYDDPRYYAIGKGSDDFLVIRYADIRTLNIEYTYIRLEPENPHARFANSNVGELMNAGD